MSHVAEMSFLPAARQPKKTRAMERKAHLAELHPSKMAERLALAHWIEAQVTSGEFVDYAELSREQKITRARISQLTALLLLAPDIQEEILSLRCAVGQDRISERDLRRVAAKWRFDEQRIAWAEVKRKRFG